LFTDKDLETLYQVAPCFIMKYIFADTRFNIMGIFFLERESNSMSINSNISDSLGLQFMECPHFFTGNLDILILSVSTNVFWYWQLLVSVTSDTLWHYW